MLRDNDCFFIVFKIMKRIKIVSIGNEKSRLLTLFPQIINEKIRTDIKRLIAFSKVYLLFLVILKGLFFYFAFKAAATKSLNNG